MGLLNRISCCAAASLGFTRRNHIWKVACSQNTRTAMVQKLKLPHHSEPARSSACATPSVADRPLMALYLLPDMSLHDASHHLRNELKQKYLHLRMVTPRHVSLCPKLKHLRNRHNMTPRTPLWGRCTTPHHLWDELKQKYLNLRMVTPRHVSLCPKPKHLRPRKKTKIQNRN